MVGGMETGVQTLYYGLGIILMLGGVVTANVKALQVRFGRHEKELVDYKLYVVERYASKEFLAESKRGILDSIRDLARRIDPTHDAAKNGAGNRFPTPIHTTNNWPIKAI
jgi:hypothetical protein